MTNIIRYWLNLELPAGIRMPRAAVPGRPRGPADEPRAVSLVVSPKVCCWSRSCGTAGVGGAAESQRAVQEHRGRLTGGEAAGGDFFCGGAEEADDGGGQPGGGECAVEVAGPLASPDDLFEPGGAGVVRILAAGHGDPGQGGAEQEAVAANELPADVEELAQRVRGRGRVEAGAGSGGA